MNTMTTRPTQAPRRLGLMLALGLMVALAIAAVAAMQPATADRFGYALSGPHGLPGHFSYQGVTYSDVGLCAGGSACAGAQATRWSKATMKTNGELPLREVSVLPTLFGADHAIYAPGNDPSMLGAGGPYVGDARPFILFIQDPASPDWYYVYQRPGGP